MIERRLGVGKLKVVGLQRRRRELDYAELRNIGSLNSQRVTFVHAPSDFSGVDPRFLAGREQSPLMSEYSVCPVGKRTIDCYHFFNSIPLNAVPFVCTAESELPRWYGADRDTFRAGHNIIASDRCRRLFAMSDATADRIHKGLQRISPELVEPVMAKVERLYPPQALPAVPVSQKKFERPELEFVFVGLDFLRKGGYELLLAAERLIDKGAEFRLHIVSPLTPVEAWGQWNWDAETKLARCAAAIKRRHRRITHCRWLSNPDVLRLFARSHVHILPSFHDTFGYSVLEAQSRLCPVVTTTQLAFPEINNEDVGWLIDVPIDHNKLMAPPSRSDHFAECSAALTEQLARMLETIVEDGARALKSKAALAQQRVRAHHDPRTIEDRIFAYY